MGVAWEELPGELGDLLLQVLFYSEMGKEQGTFSIDDVLERLANKLVHRHPHVFGTGTAETPDDVKRRWDEIKNEEKAGRAEADRNLLDSVPRSMPALLHLDSDGRRAPGVRRRGERNRPRAAPDLGIGAAADGRVWQPERHPERVERRLGRAGRGVQAA